MNELWRYLGSTDSILKISDFLSKPEFAEKGHSDRRIPRVNELRNYIRNGEHSLKEGLFWTKNSSETNEVGERLFLNVTRVCGEYTFVEAYYNAEAHVYIIHYS